MFSRAGKWADFVRPGCAGVQAGRVGPAHAGKPVGQVRSTRMGKWAGSGWAMQVSCMVRSSQALWVNRPVRVGKWASQVVPSRVGNWTGPGRAVRVSGPARIWPSCTGKWASQVRSSHVPEWAGLGRAVWENGLLGSSWAMRVNRQARPSQVLRASWPIRFGRAVQVCGPGCSCQVVWVSGLGRVDLCT